MLGRNPEREREHDRWPASYARSRHTTTTRSLIPLIAILAVLGVVLGTVGLGRIPGIPGMLDLLASWTVPAGPSGAMSRSAPTRISIPALGVRAATVEVGKAADGSIATPTADPISDTGWYEPGPSPGELGTAIIVGHVDTASRPAVFSKLSDLRHGKLIEVRRADRRTVTFTVDSVERFPKTTFPADRVFAAPGGKPRLVLVTCGGPWVGGDVGYADNIIVFATMT